MTVTRPPEDGLSVGAAAAMLGVAPETLRSYGRRYGLIPSTRTAGGHRRYSSEDVARLLKMQDLITEGLTPARAAEAVLTGATDDIVASSLRVRHGGGHRRGPGRPRASGPGGRVLAVRGAGPEVRGLARAVSRLDGDAVASTLTELLLEHGVTHVWDTVLVPLLVAAGQRWEDTGRGIDLEHVLTQATLEALRRHRSLQPPPATGPPVLLASFPDDLHDLPLHVVAACLAERRVPHRLLGARVPLETLVAARRRTGAAAVFIWRQLPNRGAPIISMPRSRPAVHLIVGGPGWEGAELAPGMRRVRNLTEAVQAIIDACRH